MLFSHTSSVHTFFMRFPIDVVFLDRELEVLDVSPVVAPWRTAKRKGARWTLELAAGEAERLRIEPGVQLVIVERDDERRAHSPRAMVGQRAPQHIASGPKTCLELAEPPRAGRTDATGDRALSEAAQREVVVVLAEVDELDDHGSSRDLRAGETERELPGDHLDAPRLDPRRRAVSTDRQRGEHRPGGEQAPQRRIVGRAKRAAPGMIASASAPSQSSTSAP